MSAPFSDTVTVWARDFGPIFTVTEDKKLEIVLFGWSAWGRIDKYVSQTAILYHIYLLHFHSNISKFCNILILFCSICTIYKDT